MGDRFSQVQESVANLNKLGWELNAQAIAAAVCPMEEIVQQMNRMFRYTPELQQTVFSLKAGQFASIGVLMPMLEEFAFRGIIQDVLLKRIPKYVMSKISPGTATALDSNIAKAARIVLTAAAFSSYHLINKGLFTEAYVSAQLVGTFALGIATGVLKESSAGMLGAIGAHMTNNVIAIMPNLLSC